MASLRLCPIAVWLIGSMMLPACGPAPANLSGQWTVKMMPDFKGNHTVEKCTIRQQDRRLSVRFSTLGSAGEELVGAAAVRHAEWHRQMDNGTKISFIADVGDSARTMLGEWHLRLNDGTELKGRFSAERTQ